MYRNLVIPDQNKLIVIKDGLLETLYPMIAITSYPVVFKLLGTFRIVIDKQGRKYFKIYYFILYCIFILLFECIQLNIFYTIFDLNYKKLFEFDTMLQEIIKY